MDSAAGSRVIRFDAFEADLTARELRRRGERLKLQDQPFQVLAALLEESGQVVTREELRERIWGDDTFVDFDKSLSAAVNKVRQALDDSRTRPRYIETLPKVGYRFIGEIEAGVGRPAGTAPDSRQSPPWRRWGLAGGLAAATLLAWSYIPSSKPVEPSWALHAVPLTAYEGFEDSPTFSPDGSQIAFSWAKNDGEGSAIYVRSIGFEQPRRLTDAEGSQTDPAWSPNGESIAYVARAGEGGRCELRLISPTGGASQTATSFVCLGRQSSLSWSADGRVVVYSDKPSVNESWGLYAVDVATLETWSLSDPPQGVIGDSGPSLSRSGERLAFLRFHSSSHATEIRTVELDPDFRAASPSQPLPFRGPQPMQNASSIVWSSDDSSLFISNGGELWQAPVRGGEARRILALGWWLEAASLDVRNNRLALMQRGVDIDIWRLDRKSGASRPLITSTQYDSYHSLSPDGKRIAWTSGRSGSLEVWVCDVDGSNPQQLTSLGSKSGAPTWSPDGDWIIFDTRVNGNSDLYVIESRGGPARPFLAGSEEDLQPSWSADGRALYFTSLRGGDVGIWRFAIEESARKPFEIAPGNVEPVVRAVGVAWAKVSPDGKFLYYRGDLSDPDESRRLYRKRLPDGEEVPLVDNVEGFDAGGDAVYFISSDKPAIWRLDPESGERQVLLELENEGNRIAVSHDGSTILFTQSEPRQADLMLVEGFE